MNIIVTGAAGFIGSEIALRLLREGHSVTGIDSFTAYYDVKLKEDRAARLAAFPNFRLARYGVEDSAMMERVFDQVQPDIILHFAAQAGVRYSLDHPR